MPATGLFASSVVAAAASNSSSERMMMEALRHHRCSEHFVHRMVNWCRTRRVDGGSRSPWSSLEDFRQTKSWKRVSSVSDKIWGLGTILRDFHIMNAASDRSVRN